MDASDEPARYSITCDLIPLGELITQFFLKYPENESWSVKPDEKEQIVEAALLENLLRRVLRSFSIEMRDLEIPATRQSCSRDFQFS